MRRLARTMTHWARIFMLVFALYILFWGIVLIDLGSRWVQAEAERRKREDGAVDAFLAQLCAEKGLILE